MKEKDKNSAILLIHCDDRKGLVSTITTWLLERNGNILEIDQYVDKHRETFFMRVEWDLTGFDIHPDEIEKHFDLEVGRPLELNSQLHFGSTVPKMALFVSTLSHCLHDVLSRYESDEWRVEIPLIISNHENLRPLAEKFKIPFHSFKITPENRSQVERRQLDLLEEYGIDLIILARYMQILPGDFITRYPGKIINIHHSFLPAFPGARPYHSGYKRGVKLIGATSHYVTEELDEGPIIEQDVIHVDHRHAVDDLIRKGRDLEKVVLARAIWHHLQHKTLVFENRAIVF